ncbi:MAG: hypothetical protein A3I06_12855 [Candidatus Lindowbacteria bacterium RIFCSPLOWO2_02_FULL_62_12]|nr:MAG: hypothetical protein A3I06_12855 [Candidatus Lindowbacteria bacterium RIFCSPLOWO2_02_FULL_62_12]
MWPTSNIRSAKLDGMGPVFEKTIGRPGAVKMPEAAAFSVSTYVRLSPVSALRTVTRIVSAAEKSTFASGSVT